MKNLGTVYTFAIGEPVSMQQVQEFLVRRDVDGATLTEASGFWKGHVEKTIVVSIAGISALRAMQLAQSMAREFNQEAIYVQFNGNGYLAERRELRTA